MLPTTTTSSPTPILDVRPIEIIPEEGNAYRLPYLHRTSFMDVWYRNIAGSLGATVVASIGDDGLNDWLRFTKPGWFPIDPPHTGIEEWWFCHAFRDGRIHPDYNVFTGYATFGGKWGEIIRHRSGQWQWSIRLGSDHRTRMFEGGGVEPNRDEAQKMVMNALAHAIARFQSIYDK